MIIAWIIWREGDRAVGIDFNCEVDVDVTVMEWEAMHSSASVSEVHSREEFESKLASWREISNREWEIAEREVFGD